MIGTVRDPVRKAKGTFSEFGDFNAMLLFEKKRIDDVNHKDHACGSSWFKHVNMQLLKIPLPSRLAEFLPFAFWVYALDCSVRNHSWVDGGFVGGSCLAVANPGCSAWVGVAGC